MNTVKEMAYAKINLFLDVTSRREDGFHNLRTIMHTISLCDELTVCRLSSGVRSVKMVVDGEVRVPVNCKNLAYQAVELYMKHLDVHDTIEIRLQKNIPVGAGLGGGSADAAAALRAMNRLYKRALSPTILLSLAQELGSDVPFCLMMKTAYCTGRGEVMTPIASPKAFHFVIAIADEFVSTPQAFAALDKKYSDFDGTVPFGCDNILPKLLNYIFYPVIQEKMLLYNIFEEAVLPLCKGARKIKKKLQSFSPLGTLMSGSGPAVYAVFESLSQALIARDALLSDGYRAFYATSQEQLL